MINEPVFRELVKQGYSRENGKRVWELLNLDLLHSSPQLSQAFLDMKDSSLYRDRIIKREIDLIKESASTLKAAIGNQPFNLIDLHCADDERIIRFIKLLGPKVKIRYCPIATNALLVEQAAQAVRKARLPNVKVHVSKPTSTRNWAESISMLRSSEYQRNVVTLLGSALAFFEINDFLFTLSKEWFKGDLLIIGNGIRTGKRLVHLQIYKSELFHKWFVHLMHGLGFKEQDISYSARFGNSRVECFYTILKDSAIDYLGKKITFKAGDEILVAVIYKYYAKELEKFCRMYFPQGEFLRDEEQEYSLVLCAK